MGRAIDMAVNVALPFFHAQGALQNDRGLMRRVRELYRGMSSPMENEITREMTFLLCPVDGGVQVRETVRHQGLIHLYRKLTAGQLGDGLLGFPD